MASSLNRIFTKKLRNSTEYDLEAEMDEDFMGFSSGSETESISERDSCDDDKTLAHGRRGRGGVAPSAGSDGKVQRNPTRRPNPKISNRNALLARENRRRKKEHVDNLEKEVEDLKEANAKIRKALKKKSKLVEQLTRERNYLKSVIANRTGIMAVLKSVQRTGFPMTSSGLSYVTDHNAVKPQRMRSSSDEGMGSSPHSMMTDEEDKFNPHDLGMAISPGQGVLQFEDEFGRLPDVEELLSTMAGEERTSCSGEQVPQREFASISFRADASRWSFALPVR